MVFLWLIIFNPGKSMRFFRQPHDIPNQPWNLQLDLKYNILSPILTILLALNLLPGHKLHVLDCLVEQHPLGRLAAVQPLLLHLVGVVHLADLVDRDRQDGPPAHEGLLGVLGLEHVAGYLLPVFLLTLAEADPVVGFGGGLAQFFGHFDQGFDREDFDVHALLVDYGFHGSVGAVEVPAGVLRGLFGQHRGFERSEVSHVAQGFDGQGYFVIFGHFCRGNVTCHDLALALDFVEVCLQQQP